MLKFKISIFLLHKNHVLQDLVPLILEEAVII